MASKLPPDYCHFLNGIPTFQPLSTIRGKIGTALFLAFWGPVMASMEKLTKSTLRKDGTVPTIVIYIVRLVIILMWCFHDYIHAPVWGRGDGLGGNAGSVAHADELAWLLGAEKC
jgi:gliotoxin/aspirochlorine biosynthesis gamma-glutamylcyclotransferase